MIRHRPAGSGHPYSPDTEQRWPVDPVAGEPLRLGVRTSDAVAAVVELERLDAAGAAVRLPLAPVVRSSRGQAVDGGHLASAQARLARQSGGWQIELDGDALEPGARYRYRFEAERPDGAIERTRWFPFSVAGWRAGRGDEIAVTRASAAAPTPVADSVEVLGEPGRARRVRFALPLAPRERVVGFGERFDALDQRGLVLDSQVFEQYKNQGRERRTYLPMPFAHVVGGTGWGFHVRTARRVWFDVGASTADRLVVEAEVGDRTDAAGLLDLALYSGAPREVLDAFLAETGRPEALPDWVFRLWASGNEWNTQAEVERQVALHAEHGIPIGALVIEAWSDESTFTVFRDAQYEVREDGSPARLADFTFPADGAWPDPKGMVDRLHDDGVRLLLWQIPLIKMRPHPTGQARADARAAIEADVLIREEAPDGTLRPYRNRGWWFPLGLMPDLADDRSARWWTEKRRYLVDEVGIDGFKTDGGEHAWGRELVYHDGSRGDEGNNRFPVAYAKAYGDLLRRAGKAPVTFSRAGFTGSAAHGAFWAGDENSTWEAFRWSLTAGLGAAASGILYWGWDLAGFSGDVPDAELYLRSAAAACFVPIMQYHSEFNHHRSPSRDRTPWNIAERHDDGTVIPAVRRLVAVRERLVPYLAAQAERSIATGAPLMRAPFFEHPDDVALWAKPHQWYLGDDLFVSPVTEAGATSWTARLPAGEWIDAWTGEPIAGGRDVTRDVALDECPVWVGASAWESLRDVFAR